MDGFKIHCAVERGAAPRISLEIAALSHRVEWTEVPSPKTGETGGGRKVKREEGERSRLHSVGFGDSGEPAQGINTPGTPRQVTGTEQQKHGKADTW